jgi:ketosteroid isomerase-like protein
MRRYSILSVAVVCFIVLLSCHSKEGDKSAQAKKEITQAEKDFEQMAADKGIAEAFSFYADSNATIKRSNDSLVHGKGDIRVLFSGDYFKKATVKWSPDFVDAAKSGDLGYDFGHYTWQSKDSTGKIQENSGVFHTVWKKQPDGSWKFVWD